MSSSDESYESPSFVKESKSTKSIDTNVLLCKIADQQWFKDLDSDTDKKDYISNKVAVFCALAWVKELDDEQRFECFLGYLQYEFLKQGLRRQQQSRDFVFYGFSAVGDTPRSTSIEATGIEVR